jgi:hypothetical protein
MIPSEQEQITLKANLETIRKQLGKLLSQTRDAVK